MTDLSTEDIARLTMEACASVYGKCACMSQGILPTQSHYQLCADRAKIVAFATTALQAENARLQQENFALAADQCHSGYGDEWGNHRCKYQDELARLRKAHNGD